MEANAGRMARYDARPRTGRIQRLLQDIRWPTEIVIQDSLQVTCERDFPRMKTATAEAERVKMLI